MAVATSRIEVGVRELKNNLSRYVRDAKDGAEVIVTERGQPVARLAALDRPDPLAALIAAGAARPPKHRARRRPTKRIVPTRPVSELVAEQRR